MAGRITKVGINETKCEAQDEPMKESISPDIVLDARGLYCPEPVMMIHNKIRDINSGQILKVIATDPSTVRDIPKFCVFLDHELLKQEEDADTFIYFIRKN